MEDRTRQRPQRVQPDVAQQAWERMDTTLLEEQRTDATGRFLGMPTAAVDARESVDRLGCCLRRLREPKLRHAAGRAGLQRHVTAVQLDNPLHAAQPHAQSSPRLASGEVGVKRMLSGRVA